VRGLVGLVIGIGLGAGAMYLALQRPWQREAPQAVQPVVADPGSEAPKKPPGKRRRGGRGGTDAPNEGAADGIDGNAAGGEAGLAEPEPPAIVLSAADRRLVWRGAEVALPAARHDFSAGAATERALSDEEIAGTVRAQSKAVVDCMVAAAAGTDLRATVMLQLLVDGSGRVTKHRVQAPQYLFDHGLAGCAERALGRWRFPAVGGFTLVNAPFDLSS
jgi:hypothetical protein